MSVIDMTEIEMTENEMTENEMNPDLYNIALRKKYNEIWKRLMKDE